MTANGTPLSRRQNDGSLWNKIKTRLTPKPNRRRWSDVNYHFGPFTYSPTRDRHYQPIALELKSANEYHNTDSREYDGCHLMVRAFSHTVIIELPEILKPHAEKVYPKTWSKETIERLGRNWYIDYTPKSYGFIFTDGSLHLHYGLQSDCSTTDKTKVIFYPWNQLRFVRESFYHADGTLATQAHMKDAVDGAKMYRLREAAKEQAPRTWFKVQDKDGTIVDVQTLICETEYIYGLGYFKWVSWFRKPKVDRSLDMRFSLEVGPEKGSWKGGLVGTSTETYPGEHPEIAFTRFLEKSRVKKTRDKLDLTYLGMCSAPEPTPPTVSPKGSTDGFASAT